MLQKELGYEFQNILYNDLCGKFTVCYLYVLDSHTTSTATPQVQPHHGTATHLPIQCTGMYICHICVNYRTLRGRGQREKSTLTFLKYTLSRLTASSTTKSTLLHHK